MCGVGRAGRYWQGAAGSGICRCCGETEEKHSRRMPVEREFGNNRILDGTGENLLVASTKKWRFMIG